MGSVSPLLAVCQELRARDAQTEFLWIGTVEGPERSVIEAAGIRFETIPSAKFRRYLSLQNLIDPFKMLMAVRRSKKLLKEFQPDLVLTAGSYIAVSVARAARSLKVPYFVHQQDIIKGLANKLMEKHAVAVTITFDQSLNDFPLDKTSYTSNPVRSDAFACEANEAQERFGLDPSVPMVLITGGGTGAAALNQLTLEALGALTEQMQVVHLTGVGKGMTHLLEDYYTREEQFRITSRYIPLEFVREGMCALLKRADVVVSRAGISSLTELSLLNKASMIMPIPDSHQEANARYFAKYNAIRLLDQKSLDGVKFAAAILDLMGNEGERRTLQRNIAQMIDPQAAKRYVDLIEKFLRA